MEHDFSNFLYFPDTPIKHAPVSYLRHLSRYEMVKLKKDEFIELENSKIGVYYGLKRTYSVVATSTFGRME